MEIGKDEPTKFDNFPMSSFPLNEWFILKKCALKNINCGREE